MKSNEDKQWLKEAIIKYFQNRPKQKPDSIDVCIYFKLRVDITLTAIGELIQEGKLIRHDTFGGMRHYLEMTQPTEPPNPPKRCVI